MNGALHIFASRCVPLVLKPHLMLTLLRSHTEREAKRGGRSKHLSETLGGTVYLLSPTKNNHKQVLFNTGLDEVLQRCRLPIAVITA